MCLARHTRQCRIGDLLRVIPKITDSLFTDKKVKKNMLRVCCFWDFFFRGKPTPYSQSKQLSIRLWNSGQKKRTILATIAAASPLSMKKKRRWNNNYHSNVSGWLTFSGNPCPCLLSRLPSFRIHSLYWEHNISLNRARRTFWSNKVFFLTHLVCSTASGCVLLLGACCLFRTLSLFLHNVSLMPCTSHPRSGNFFPSSPPIEMLSRFVCMLSLI